MPYQPGQSGNPGGRPAQSEAFKKRAREEAYRALEVLIAAMDDESVDVRMKAAIAVIERAHGKPPQAIVGDSDYAPVMVQLMAVDANL